MINLIIGACSFLLLLFSIKLLFTKSDNRYINIVLALIIFGRLGLNLVYLAADTATLIEFPLLLKLFNPFYYLVPSGMYLYIRGLMNFESKFRKIDLLHFLPFLFGFLDITYYFAHPNELLLEVNNLVYNQEKYFYYYISGPITTAFKHILRPLLFTLYYIFIVRLLYKKNLLKFGLELDTKQKWVLILVTFTSISHLLQLFQWYNHFLGEGINYYNNDTGVFVIFPVLVLLGIILFIFQNPDILYGHLYILKKWQHNREVMIDNALQSKVSIYDTEDTESLLKIKESKEVKELIPYPLAVEYANQMIQIMAEKKMYQHHDLQIIEISKELNILVHHCSYVLNRVLGKNFRDWINEFRINHFIELYKAQRNSKTIEALASESGFKNTATFYNAFKKSTGLSPSQYFKQ
jgi:AraC-like DNA-binding protein